LKECFESKKFTTEWHGVSLKIVNNEDLSYKSICPAREVYKKLGPGYNVEKGILIIQCNSVKIRENPW